MATRAPSCTAARLSADRLRRFPLQSREKCDFRLLYGRSMSPHTIVFVVIL
jgi:hypothetical protein